MFAALVALFAAGSAIGQGVPDYERPPVNYSAATPNDALTKLKARLAAGEFVLAGPEKEMVQRILRELGVPVESQLLVFSKTSLQRGRIRPQRPRALYFSDSVYVGWVPGGLVEITTIDPQLGPVFYTFELPIVGKTQPAIARDSDCLRCHGGSFVRDIPGVFARSVFPSQTGEPMLRFGTVLVDDQTPFEQRWGGWYVTGYHGAQVHRGNVLGAEVGEQLVFEPTDKRPDDVTGMIDASDYPVATSDIVALLVIEHQMAVQNSLTRASFACRKMIAYQHSLQTHFKEPLSDEPVYDSVKSVFASSVQDVVDRLLFRGEAPLPDGVKGSAEFRKAFAQGAPRSGAGHALKDLRLKDRIFEQRCSYMIYSEAFRALPETLKAGVFDRLFATLRSRDPQDRYSYLGDAEKQRIFDILIETHPDAKTRWSEAAAAPAVQADDR